MTAGDGERPYWVVRYQDDGGLVEWLAGPSGTREVIRWTHQRPLAYEHDDRHDAYTARDEARDALATVEAFIPDDSWGAPENIRVVRGYRS